VAVLPFFGYLIRPLIAGAIMAALMSTIPPVNFMVMGLAAVLLYGLGMVILQPSIISEVRLLIVGGR